MKRLLIGWICVVIGLHAQEYRKRHPGFPMGRSQTAESLLPSQWIFLPSSEKDETICHLFVQIPYPRLLFRKEGDLFTASFELTILIRKGDEIVTNRIRRGLVRASLFPETRDPTSSRIESFEIPLIQGEYTLYIELFDTESANRISYQKPLTVPNLKSSPFSFSPLLFFRVDGPRPAPLDSPPLFTPYRLQDDTSLHALIFLFSDGSPKQLRVRYAVLNASGDTITSEKASLSLSELSRPFWIPIVKPLEFGSYRLVVSVTDGETRQQAEGGFAVKWGSHAAFMPHLDLAIASLIYVVDPAELKALETRSRTEKIEWLSAFWKARDPDPETEFNGLQDEYYRRVITANERFTVLGGSVPGWKTDRGRIYIIYGPPSDVETRSTEFESASRYEIWYYRNLQKRFVFLDRFGTGDYRLIAEE